MSETSPSANLETVRRLLLSAQGLLHPPKTPAGKDDVLDVIRRMGALQIDTIHVVARSPYLVLFSRLGDYDPRWLDELQAEGKLFEYWSHAACFLPIEDYSLYRHRMHRDTQRYYTPEWGERHQETIEAVLSRIRENGPVRSADFERNDGIKGTWWNWKEEKQVLEYLHTTGELMIARREKFQRVYDLQQRVLPGWEESRTLSMEEARTELTVRAVRALGIAPARWIPDYFRHPKTGMAERLKRLVKEERLVTVAVEGWKEPGYLHPDHLPLLQEAAAGGLQPSYSTLLSPFDPLVWDRDRGRTLFDFDYTIECYTPEAKRRYGYFSLPILSMGKLVGRLDAKAHRKEGRFEVRAIYLEPNVEMTEKLVTEVGAAIQRCAAWHGTPQVEISRSEPDVLKNLLQEVIS